MLIRKIIKGDEEAFDSLVKKHYNNIYHYCFRKTGNKEIAKDLTQEVFMKLIRSIHRYRFTGKFTNFLFTIAVNTCNDFYRYYYRQKKDVYPRGDFNDQVDERANPQE
ncbi:MAG TPA: RNA polymerase sigma factor, partial [Bacillota bacterium]|nr:RNA polymerase sigma factor [Bacillota bacterium]